MTRAIAEKLLEACPQGVFVIRPSSQPDCLALSHRRDDGVGHALIFSTPHGFMLERTQSYFPTVMGVLQSQPLRFDFALPELPGVLSAAQINASQATPSVSKSGGVGVGGGGVGGGGVGGGVGGASVVAAEATTSNMSAALDAAVAGLASPAVGVDGIDVETLRQYLTRPTPQPGGSFIGGATTSATRSSELSAGAGGAGIGDDFTELDDPDYWQSTTRGGSGVDADDVETDDDVPPAPDEEESFDEASVSASASTTSAAAATPSVSLAASGVALLHATSRDASPASVADQEAFVMQLLAVAHLLTPSALTSDENATVDRLLTLAHLQVRDTLKQ